MHCTFLKNKQYVCTTFAPYSPFPVDVQSILHLHVQPNTCGGVPAPPPPG